jgi:hypothetical protein
LDPSLKLFYMEMAQAGRRGDLEAEYWRPRKTVTSTRSKEDWDFALRSRGSWSNFTEARLPQPTPGRAFHGKFDKVRTVPMLTPESIEAAKAQIETESQLCTMNPQHFRDVLARAARRLGFPTSHPSPHFRDAVPPGGRGHLRTQQTARPLVRIDYRPPLRPRLGRRNHRESPPDSPALAGRRRLECHTKCHTAAPAKSFIK